MTNIIGLKNKLKNLTKNWFYLKEEVDEKLSLKGYINYQGNLVLIDDETYTIEIRVRNCPDQAFPAPVINLTYKEYNNQSYQYETVQEHVFLFPIDSYKDRYIDWLAYPRSGTVYLYELEDSDGMPISVDFNDLPTEPQEE